MDNIIQINFKEGYETAFDDNLKQWDKGQKLQISGLDISTEIVEVHFSLQEIGGTAKRMLGTVTDGVIHVDIPNLILAKENVYQQTYDAYAWIYLSEDESAETVRKIIFTIEARAKPENYVSDDDPDIQQQYLATVVAEREKAEAAAKQAEESAKKAEETQSSGIDEETFLKLAIKPTTEESTFLHITDSADYKVLDMGMRGIIEQPTTEGKNYYSGGDVSGTGSNGVVINTIPAGIYTVSAVVTSSDTDSTVSLILFRNADSSYLPGINLSRGTDRTSKTITFTDDIVQVAFYASNSNNNSVDDTFSFTDIQIEPGDTATDYEVYTGQMASPNPDYSQEIVLAGERGKNLFNLTGRELVEDLVYSTQTTQREFTGNKIFTHISSSNYTQPVHEITYTIDENTVTVSTSDLSYGVGFDVKVDGGQEYTLSRTSGVLIKLAYFDVDGYWISETASSTLVKTFTVPDDAAWMLVVLMPSTKDTDTVYSDIQIELGSTATDYEPYTERYLHKCCVGNKNLWDAEYASDIGNWSEVNGGYPSIRVKVPKGSQISVSYKNTLTTGISNLYVCVSRNGNHSNSYSYIYHSTVSGLIRNSITFTAEDEYIYICCASVLYIDGLLDTFMENIGNDLQIEIADASTELEVHQSQKFTLTSDRPLTMWDDLDWRDGVWGWSIYSYEESYDEKNLPTVVAVLDNLNGDKYFVIENNNLPSTVTGINKPSGTSISDSFIENNPYTYSSWCMWKYLKTLRLFIGDETVTDKATLLEWIAEHPFKVIYQTAEEQAFIPLPDEEQTLLNNLVTYYGVTNIYSEEGCPIWIKYVADSKLYIDKQILEIKSAIV